MYNNQIVDEYNFENKNEYNYSTLINEYNNNTLINWSDNNVNSIINEFSGNEYTLSYKMDITFTDSELTEMYNNNTVSEYKVLESPTIDFKLTESENFDLKHSMECLEQSFKDIKGIFEEIQTTQEMDLITVI
jgi:hypothetical protein